MPRNPRPNPYVGPRAFQTGETLYGRDRETRQLLDLLIAERIVLLHSPSGAGKSSLIQAGLIPQLEAEGFQVLPVIRVNLESQVGEEGRGERASNRYLLSTLLSLEEGRPPGAQIPLAELAKMSLSEYLERLEASLPSAAGGDGNGGSTVLIFDQFEEILTLDPTGQAMVMDFFTQAGAALRNRSRWALFAIREDYLAALEPYTRPVPTRLANTFRLDLLQAESACQAVRQPPQEKGVVFAEPAALKLVDDLRRVQVQQADGTMLEQPGPYVEPVQLQVVCYRLWENLDPGDLEISEEDITAVGDVNQSLADYYAEQVAAAASLAVESERRIRAWIGEQLITPSGIRSQVLMEPEASGGLSNQAIRQLVAAHLVRGEKRRGITWFELAHDRLVAPIRQDNAAWEEAHLSLLQRQAALWDRQGRPEHLLLRDAALQDAAAWAAANPGGLDPIEAEFLKSCQEVEHRLRDAQEQAVKLQAAQQSAEAERKRAEAERLRAEEQVAASTRLRRNSRIIFVLAIAGGVISLVALYATWQATRLAAQRATLIAEARSAANQAQLASTESEIRAGTAEAALTQAAVQSTAAAFQKTIADQKGESALSSQLTNLAFSLYPKQYDLGLLLALEANRITDTVESRGALLSGLQLNPFLDTVLRGHTGEVRSVAYSPNGRILASAGDDRTIRLWDVENATPYRPPMEVAGGSILSLVFSHDGALLFSGGCGLVDRNGCSQGQVQVWDVASGASLDQGILPAEVTSLAISADGSLVAAGSRDGKVTVWDVVTSALLGTSTEPNTPGAISLAFAPQGALLAVGDSQGLITLWELQRESNTSVLRARLKGHRGAIHSLSFGAQGQILASASEDRTVLVWDLAGITPDSQATLAPFRELQSTDGGPVRAVAFYPEGKILALAGSGGQISLWDLGAPEAAPVQQAPPSPPLLSAHTGMLDALAFSSDGRRLASAGQDQAVIQWNTALLASVGLAAFQGDQASSTRLAAFSFSVSQDPADLAFTLDGKTLLLQSGTQVQPLDPQTGEPQGGSQAYDTPGGRLFLNPGGLPLALLPASGGDQGGQQVAGTDLSHWQSRVDWAQVIEAGISFVIIKASEGDSITDPAFADYWAGAGQAGLVRGAYHFFRASAGADQQVKNFLSVYAPEPGDLPPALDLEDFGGLNNTDLVQQVGAWLDLVYQLTGRRALVFTFPSFWDEHMLVNGQYPDWAANYPLWIANPTQAAQPLLPKSWTDWTLWLYDFHGNLPGVVGEVDRIRFNGSLQDLKNFATGQESAAPSPEGSQSTLFDLDANAPLGPPLAAPLDYTAIAISADRKTLALGSANGQVRRWDLNTGQPTGDPANFFSLAVTALAISPDGRWLVGGSQDGSLRFLDLALGVWATDPLPGHTGAVNRLAFSPDGQTLASGGADGQIMLWNVLQRKPTGQPIRDTSAPVTSLAFHPNGRILAAAYADRKVVLWQVDVGQWRTLACRVANRNLTPEEWVQYLPGVPVEKTCPNLP